MDKPTDTSVDAPDVVYVRPRGSKAAWIHCSNSDGVAVHAEWTNGFEWYRWNEINATLQERRAIRAAYPMEV